MGLMTQAALRVRSNFNVQGFPQLSQLMGVLLDQAIMGQRGDRLIHIYESSGEDPPLLCLGNPETGESPMEDLIRMAPELDRERLARLDNGTIVSVRFSQVPTGHK